MKESVFSFSNDKARGSDGFSMTFFQESWEILKDDLFRVLEEFYESGIINLKTNHSLICLIPKKGRLSRLGMLDLLVSLQVCIG